MMTDSDRFDSRSGLDGGAASRMAPTHTMERVAILRGTGEFAWWTQPAQELLADFGLSDFLQSTTRRCETSGTASYEIVRGAWRVRLTRLWGPGPAHYLAVLTPHAPQSRDAALSPAQLRVSRLAATGATAREIAQMVGIAPGTVRTHLGIVYRKLGVTTRVGLARALEGW